MDAERKPFLTWLIVITVIGSALRLYHLNEIPYTYDELSALSRTHYHSFPDLIQQGVAGDGHPAGVQVFLYYWVKIFGDAEWVVKLPFILTGILCIPLIYLTGKKWFNPSAAIIAASLMAGLQYPVMYSQIARPYISGLFLILLLTVIWNEVVRGATIRNLAAFAVVLALCAYNHYFSLLTAACIVATGFLVIERKYLLKYILAIALSAVLFLPHLHLFLGQLKLKGLEWLSAPTREFFPTFLYCIFNFSDYILAAIVLLVVQGIYFYLKQRPQVQIKYRLIALLWFVIPAAVGYFYSIYRAPVLQDSVLIFGFPFLLLFASSFVTLPAGYLRDAEISLLLLLLVFSLGWERNYYQLFYHAQTEMFAMHISGYEKAYGKVRVAAIINTNPRYLDYYKKKYNTDWTYKTFDDAGDNIAWRKWLKKSDADYLILGNPPIEWGNQYLAIAEEYFTCVDSVFHGFTTDIYVLKKRADTCKPGLHPLYTFKAGYAGARERNAGIYLSCDTLNDKGLLFITAQQLGFNEKLKIDISADVYVDSASALAGLTLNFKNLKGDVLQHRTSPVQSFANDTGWHKVYLTARLCHAPSASKVAYISAGFYGKPETCIHFRNFKFELVPDNPVLYAFIKK